MATASSNTVKRLSRAVRGRPARRGLTLIELVMVVALLGLLAAIAIPGVQMAVEGRAIREAARSVNVFLGSARNRAMTTGRPVGVAFQRFSDADPYDNMCITLHQIETAPPYAGETMSSRARVYFNGGVLTAQLAAADFDATKVTAGDRIQFNHQGPWYAILPPVGTETLTLDTDSNRLYPWPNALADAEFMPYEIHGQPQVPDTVGPRRAAFSKPLQLPLDAVVDLTFSGLHVGEPTKIPITNPAQGHFSRINAASARPVVIVFSPNGGLEGVYYGLSREVPNEPVYLLVGKRERIPAGSADDGRSNLRDPECLWVTVSPRSGLINTVENAQVAADTEIAAARAFTLDQQSMGGR